MNTYILSSRLWRNNEHVLGPHYNQSKKYLKLNETQLIDNRDRSTIDKVAFKYM